MTMMQRIRHITWVLCSGSRNPLQTKSATRNLNAGGEHTMNDIILSDDGASFKATLPGWSATEMAALLSKMDKPWYLRVWKVSYFIDLLQEYMKKNGCLDTIDFEQTHLTYYKGISMERLIPVQEMNELFHRPYGEGITIKHYLSRIGKTSFQVNSDISLSSTGQQLFRWALLSVCVDLKTRVPSPCPEWWVTKYKNAITLAPALRLELPRSHTDDNLIYASELTVQPLDLDYYGHANNNAYIQYAMQGLLGAQMHNKLKMSAKEVENKIRKMEVDFIGDCSLGDTIKVQVYQDPKDSTKMHVLLKKHDDVVFVQCVSYSD